MPREYTSATDEEFLIKFNDKIDKTTDEQGCWLYTKCILRSGYGQVWWKGKKRLAHVVSYLLSGRTIPEGYVVCHSGLCKNKRHCVNPDHLTADTHANNMGRDKVRDGTDGKGERNTNAVLTVQDVLEIRRRVGESQTQLAKEFGIKQAAIWKILNRKTWKHI